MHMPSSLNLKSSIAAALIFTAGAFAANAQTTISTADVPRTISYQGLLTSSENLPFSDGRYDITVTLYNDPQGNNPVWREAYATDVTGGLFNLYLGAGNKPLPGADVMNAPLWIGTAVNGQEMRPLTPLTAAPYALNVPDRSITPAKLADGAVTAEKVDMDYISELHVDGQKVSGKGTVLNLVSTPGIPLSYDQATHSLTIGRASAQTGDREKRGSVLASPLAWDSQGDLTDGASGGQPTTAGDWLGTSANAANGQFDLEFKVEGEHVMLYQTTGVGGIPNIIGGDAGNTISSSQASIIAEGKGHSISHGHYNTISGGEGNTISDGAHNVVAGGQSNTDSDGDYNAIGGGENNSNASGNHNAIAGGLSNSTAYASYGFVGGGTDNHIFNPGGYAITAVTISGGENNRAEIDYTTIGGGRDNTIAGANPGTTEYSTIGGGWMNLIDGFSNNAMIGGGGNNRIVDNAAYAVIAGGSGHFVSREYTTISGGQDNFIDDTSPYAAIGGGGANVIGSNGDYSTIGGGGNNSLSAQYGTISGGFFNSTGVNSVGATVSGGQLNAIAVNSRYSAIGGGSDNSVEDEYGTIAGGRNNSIDNTSQSATIGGGRDNIISSNGDYSFIGGGERNNTQGTYTTIPGGDRLLTNASYAQSAMGFYNAPRGAMPTQPTAAQIAASGDPLFMVGNGVVGSATPTRSNAFEVSYNGHTSVYHVNGSGATTPSIAGGTFVDNVIYAWGNIPAGGGPFPAPIVPNSDFGVRGVTRVGVGVYDIRITSTNPAGTAVSLTGSSVTATIADNASGSYACYNITATPVGTIAIDTFRVRITNGSCSYADAPFMFKVTGRP